MQDTGCAFATVQVHEYVLVFPTSVDGGFALEEFPRRQTHLSIMLHSDGGTSEHST